MFYTLLAGLLTQSLLAQELIQFDTSPAWCGTDAFAEEYFRENPEARAAFTEKMEAVYQYRDQLQAKRSSEQVEPFVIPVVVHVVHDNGVGDISFEQIQDAINLLNEDYRRTNSDADDTREIFKNIAGAAPFEFRLAKIDPFGNPTDGVVRINDPVNTYNTRNEVKGVSYWNSSRYFNMWVVNSIRGSGGGTVLGFAQFPGVGSWNTYGLVMRHDQFGRIGTSRADGRTLTHEVGHCLGLYHTFQSGCGSDCSATGDRICDTPPVSESSWGCSFTQNSCANDQSGSALTSDSVVIALDRDYPDQIENYMSYDACQNMFSKGQVDVMVSVMSMHNRLINLVSEPNLLTTGVGQLYEANFSANKNVVCAGDAVRFADQSFYGQKLWAWTLPGAEPETPGVQNPEVVYNTPGIYNARLSVSNGTDIRNKFIENMVLVSPKRGYFNDFDQDFEDGIFPSSKWIAVDETEDGVTWKITNAAASSGSNAIKLSNFNAALVSTEALYTSSYDLSPFESAVLKFKYAFAEKYIADNDRLIISYSTDCGETWSNFWNVSNGNLATTTAVPNGEFVPGPNDWKSESRALLPAMLTEGLQFKFWFLNGGGNSIYIDDFSIEPVWKNRPTLQSPASGEVVDGFDVTLDWKSHPDADEYEYQLSTDNSFASVLKSGVLTAIDMNPENIDTEFKAIGLERGKIYFWRVRAIDGGTPGVWSDVWFFQISQTVSKEEMLAAEKPELKIYPNPGSSQITLNVLGAKSEYRITVRDVSGKIVHSSVANPVQNETKEAIDVRAWAKGVYLVNLQSENDNLNSKLIIR